MESVVRKPLVEDDLDDKGDLQQETIVDRAPEPRSVQGFSLEDGIVNEFMDCRNVTFTGPVRFRNVTFAEGFSFNQAVFQSTVRFIDVTVVTAGGNKSVLSNCTFKQSASFQGSTLYLADFSSSNFEGSANFARARFNASANFDDARFASSVNFKRAQFNGAGNFRGTTFTEGANFDEVEFRHQSVSHARYTAAIFGHLASFEEAQFSGHAEFGEAQFLGGAIFSRARFGERSDAEPSGSGDSTEDGGNDHVQADRRIDFSSATFQPSPDGEVASFFGVKFGDRNFVREAVFDGAEFGSRKAHSKHEGTVDFRQSQASSGLSLRSTIVGSGIGLSFQDAHIEDDLDLTGAEFFDHVAFDKTKSRGLILADAEFRKVPDLRQASFVHPPRLYQAHLPDKLFVARSEKHTIAPLLGALRKIAVETNDKRTEAKVLVHELRLDGGFASRLYGLISNYGQSWLRPTLWLLVFVFFIFPMAHLAVHDRIPTTPQETSAAIDKLGPPCSGGKEGNALAAAIELSINSSMIVGPENEARQQRVKTCLRGPQTAGFRPAVLGTVVEALQVIVTGIFLFFIGGSIRRRFQMR